MSKGQQFFISKILVVNNFDNLETAFADFLAKNNSSEIFHQQIQWLGDPEDSFGIDEVRSLQEQLAFSRPDSEEWWYLIRNGNEISLPAQHALLKMLEEPPDQTHICIVTSKPRMLLPTIQSRCATISLEDSGDLATEEHQTTGDETFQKVEKASLSEMIDLAAQFKEKSDAYNFFMTLQKRYYDQLKLQPDNSKIINKLNAIQNALDLLQTNVNIRILVEHTLFQMIHKVS